MSTQEEEVPAVCETCLGPNPYLRMIRETSGLECKFCTRPFTVFKWAPVRNGPFKHTVICLTCAKQRNCCQSCLLDLTYGIPIQLRDAALRMAGIHVEGSEGPKNEVSKLFVANNSDRFESIGGAAVTSDADKAREILTKLAMSQNKGKSLTKKREENKALPAHIEKVDVTKIVSKLPFNGSLNVPEDVELKTLFVFGIDESLAEYKITDYFEKFGHIKSFNCQQRARCGFITFTKRIDAETAAKTILESQKKETSGAGIIVIENIPLRVCWGKERPLGSTNAEKLKIGSIVSKVMKKLSRDGTIQKSDKKKAIEAPASTSEQSEPKLSVRKETPSKTSYKSISKNFEL